MLWLQLSWYICLAGGQLSYSIQHGADYMFTRDSANLSRCDHDALCLYIMSGVCKRFADGLPPLTYEQIAQDTKLPLHLVRGLMDEMLAAKLLNEVYSSRKRVGLSTGHGHQSYHAQLCHPPAR